MRIHEIISEGSRGKLRPDHKASLHGVSTFNDGHGHGADHNFNRVGLAVAMADGGKKKLDIDDRTWYHSDNVAVPYSDLEHRMLDQAFRSVKTKVNHVVKDHSSREHDSIHRASPVPAKKRNKYGV